VSRFCPSSRQIEEFLTAVGFKCTRQKGSHQQFFGIINGVQRRVTVMVNQDWFTPDTLASMIRQSGLPKKKWIEIISKI
jgi:predicted RNA binding protein YcfA (HicA-like mRNA interferase family)